ncbi:MAG: hypothetical protein LAO20_14270 [Acidobacteriia bacterium]|nr:hypothetical protein [Terriglobia bacterium]
MIHRRYVHARKRLGLGYPVLPDQFISASGQSFSFSPQTPDATQISVLQQFGQQLPADLAAKWAAAQAAASTSAPTPAVTPSGTPVSTQTGATVTLVNTLSVAPGVFQCNMSDGSSHYCDASGAAIAYTPPAATPVATPSAASAPTSTVAPAVTQSPASTPASTPTAVTPSGLVISTTTGTPAQTSAPAPADFMASIATWLQGAMIGGIPNWVLLAGGAALLMFSGGKKR